MCAYVSTSAEDYECQTEVGGMCVPNDFIQFILEVLRFGLSDIIPGQFGFAKY